MWNTSLSNCLWHGALIVVLIASGISCSQYEYDSPTPGVLEIRLRTKNNRADFLRFGGGNSFYINLKSLEGLRGQQRLTILPDLNSIQRSVDGDIFNTLDTLARDSAYVLGQAYAPPATYTSLDITAEVLQGAEFIQLISSYGFPTAVQVVAPTPTPPALNSLPRPGESLGITVNEGRRTVVNVMLDLDSTLVRRTEFFECDLQFYVSSIQNY